MVTTRLNSPFTERRLERALIHVSDFWFPANEKLLSQIRNEIASAPDETSVPDIIASLRGDFSLFFHTLRSLAEKVRAEGGSPDCKNPISLLEEGGIDALRAIFSDPASPSKLSFSEGSKAQLARFHEMLVSSTTATTLADSYGVDEHSAYVASVIRQLGLTLIAWNYPGIYQEAIMSASGGQSLEMEISRKLGFSPQLLAIRLFKSWGFSESFCKQFGLEDTSLDDAEGVNHAMADTLAELCRVGEALARAHHPEIYPSARKDWEDARGIITTRLGREGVQIIEDKVREHLELFYDFMPEVYDHGLSELYDLPSEVKRSLDPSEIGKNPFLVCCTPDMGRAIRRLYHHIDGGMESSVSTRVLVDEVLPIGRFSGGCIYTADPAIMMLMPQFPFGKLQLRKPQGVDYSIVLSNADLVSLAFQDAEPVVEYRVTEAGEIITAVAGMFGGVQRVGVLYLEIPEMISDFIKDQHILHFQAVRHALVDCLQLT